MADLSAETRTILEIYGHPVDPALLLTAVLRATGPVEIDLTRGLDYDREEILLDHVRTTGTTDSHYRVRLRHRATFLDRARAVLLDLGVPDDDELDRKARELVHALGADPDAYVL